MLIASSILVLGHVGTPVFHQVASRLPASRLPCISAEAAAPSEDVDKTVLLYPGGRDLPALVQVPGDLFSLRGIVKPPDVDVLTQWEQDRGNVDSDSSWGSVWPAAANLAALIASTPDLVRGQRVAELGCGLGLVGLTAAKMGAATVTLVDREPLALHCAMSTASVCNLPAGPVPDGGAVAGAFYADSSTPSSGVVSATMVGWDALVDTSLTVDVVLASEVLYDSSEVVSLARSAAHLLKDGGTLLLSDPEAGRVADARAALLGALREMGASVSEEALAPPLSQGDGWYSLRAGDGKASVAAPTEPTVLVRAVFDGSSSPRASPPR